ncbi:MAG: hypothetical protein R3F33_09285 [Planctomycetota bacterium]
MSSTPSDHEAQCVEEVFQRVAGDLSMIADMDLDIVEVQSEILDYRAAGGGVIHIAFRLGFEVGGELRHGCLVVPLADAVTLACSLMMVSPDVIAESRKLDTLDPTSKDAMLEVGSFVGGATDAAFRALDLPSKVSFEGCQGVRADVRPALIYHEGEALLTARATVRLGEFGESTYLLLIPRAACTAGQLA